MRKTKTELSEILYALTLGATEVYFDTFKKDTLDKQLWAFLHLGFAEALQQVEGYEHSFIEDVLKLTREKMTKFEFQIKNQIENKNHEPK